MNAQRGNGERDLGHARCTGGLRDREGSRPTSPITTWSRPSAPATTTPSSGCITAITAASRAHILRIVRDHGRAEDLTQDVFVSALRRMRETDRPIAFKPWIYEIAKNAVHRRVPARRGERTRSASTPRTARRPSCGRASPATGPSPHAAVDAKQCLDDLCGAFDGLSDTHHQILVMRELEGLSYREIGERLGMSRASVESTLFRARRRLIEEYDELPPASAA